MPDAGKQLLDELTGWAPQGGVVSVYVEIDPADRSEGWRIDLKNKLAGVDRAAAERVLARFPPDSPLPRGRTQVGFVELGGARREIWRGFQTASGATTAAQGDLPRLEPLMRILDDGGPFGVVVVSIEAVRVLEWTLGEVVELDGWELEVTSLDWHERKAPRRDPTAGTGVSASGRDQYAQRLDHNREQFLKQAGRLVASRYGDRDWRQLLVIGEADRPKLLIRGLGAVVDRVHEVHHDLIRAAAPEIAARVDEQLEGLNRAREQALIAQVERAIGSRNGAALGPEEVLETLAEGRAHHVIFDATREWERRDGVPISELMIQRALATDARVTPVEGSAAETLAERDGAVALLRY